VEFDAGDALNRHQLGVWLTDRISAEGGWKDGMDPLELIRHGEDPILCLTHPNNWCSGFSLWADRLSSTALPGSPAARALRTGTDEPPRAQEAGKPPRIVRNPSVYAAAPARSFSPIAVAMRREILRHYYERELPLTSSAALRTLDTNSTLAESRAEMLEQVLKASGLQGVRGRQLLDLGCGFGSLALVFAARGASVTALDPNAPRQDVGREVADQFQLPVAWVTGSMDAMELDSRRFDIAVMNNSLCYVVDRTARHQALQRTWDALRPGGSLVIRDPKRYRLCDQFTRLPLVGMLPPSASRVVLRILGTDRSDVRLVSRRTVRQELRRAGFVDIRAVRAGGRGGIIGALERYQHLTARRPIR
jgi:2-polyprenyl-3-methyl-5-hydroxy-6-metoxy-1,4-benzoquinol methylase